MQRVRISAHRAPVHKLGDTQMTLSPKFRLPAIQSSLANLTLEGDLSDKGEPLIPGLPDDISLSCLLRLPVESHTDYKIVSKRWYVLFGRKETFFAKRKELGFYNPWLYVLAFGKCTGKVQWLVLDLSNLSWHKIPAMPCKDKVCPHGISCVSVPHEGTLYVCGGMASDANCPLNVLLKYEIRKNRWTAMNKMITPRAFFASGIIDGKIYIAGGNSLDLDELNSAEVIDTKGNGNWGAIADMETNMSSYDSAVLDGKLLLTEGWFWPFCVVPRGQVYDPKIDKWEIMASGLREGWTGSSVVIFDRLFVVTEHERTKLKVYDVDTDSWDCVGGPSLPDQICKPFSVSCSDNRLFVVGRNLHVAIGVISIVPGGEHMENNMSFSVQWVVVSAPKGFSELTPSSAQVLFG